MKIILIKRVLLLIAHCVVSHHVSLVTNFGGYTINQMVTPSPRNNLEEHLKRFYKESSSPLSSQTTEIK